MTNPPLPWHSLRPLLPPTSNNKHALLHPSPCTTGNKKFCYERLGSYTTCIFSTPMVPMKLNPVIAMKQLYQAMLKDKLSLGIQNASNNKQINLASVSIPTGKKQIQEVLQSVDPFGSSKRTRCMFASDAMCLAITALATLNSSHDNHSCLA